MAVEQHDKAAGDYVNTRGLEVERNLSRLLGTLCYVVSVRETQKNSQEDHDKKDLVIGLDRTQAHTVVSEVFVQAKASSTGVASFRHHLNQELKKQGGEGLTQEEWLLAHRLVVLVGDMHISRSGKHRYPVTEEQILTSFEDQLKRIDDYHRSRI